MTISAEPRHGLGSRLAALARVVELGQGRVDAELLTESTQLLIRAGNRLKLSPEHTVVALAGGTGSGKSSLFNSISGLELSPTGVRRPTTARTHACVWGLEGAAPLLDWLQVQWRHRFARASALDRGEAQLHGLILLDLPDHDSIRALTDTEADRLIQSCDLVVWVLDPQKYADASTHRRYVTELAGHDAVTVFVLNQADKLTPEEQAICVADLEELLQREGVVKPKVVTTSATTGSGIDRLKEVLAESVGQRRAGYLRLEADLDRHMKTVAPELPELRRVDPQVDGARKVGLVDALCDAVGAAAVGEAIENVYAVRSADYVSWPFARISQMLGRDPLKSLHLGDVKDEIRTLVSGSVAAQPAEVDNAVQALSDGLSQGMPDNWRDGVRDAARSRSAQLPKVLTDELGELAPPLDRVPAWWWLARVWQWLLILLFVAGLAVSGAIIAYGVAEAGTPPAALLGDVGALPWVGLMMVAVLGLGALSALACRNLVILRAGIERDKLERDMRRRVSTIAQELVVDPVERELRRYNEFFEAMATARH